MVNGISNTYDYNGNTYVRRSSAEAEIGASLATLVSGLIYKALPPFSNPFLRQMHKEHANNELYRDAFIKAVDLSGLQEKGLNIKHLDFLPQDYGRPIQKIENYDVKKGLNAYFSPDKKEIVLNMDKASISGFHELGHAMNNMSGKLGKILQKLRRPGYILAGAMGSIALFTRPKPKDAPRNTMDWIQDNCHWIAAAGMLPTVAEEALASHNGIKMAKKSRIIRQSYKKFKKILRQSIAKLYGVRINNRSIGLCSKQNNGTFYKTYKN